jgi:hypothetical protein
MSSLSALTIEWGEFVHISDIECDGRNEGGVYIWGFTIDKKFIPYYVGIAKNLIFRMHEHINFIIGGRYTIYHRNSLANFKEFKDQEPQIDKSKGKIYLPDWPYGYKYFINNRKTLRQHIDFMVDTFTFSFAIIDKSKDSWNSLNDIEKLCIHQIGKENLANTRVGYCNNFELTHTGNDVLQEWFKGI